jgi:Winged helix DNA-binding domain
MWKSNFGNKRFGGNDVKAVHRAGVKLLDKGPMTGGQLGKALQEKFQQGDALSKSVLLQVKEILVQIPPTRIWGSGHAPILTRAQNWVPAPHSRELKLADLVRRYLRAYGPASVADMQSWSGLTKLGETFAALGSELVTLAAEDGRTLYDLPDAPRPDPDTPARPRFLPLYDNVYLGYDNRRRMLAADDSKRVNLLAEFKPAVLVDGTISAGWAIEVGKGRAVLSIEPYHALRKADVRALEKEGAAFLKFMEPDASDFDVAVTAVRP